MNKFLWIILGVVLSLGAHAQSHAGMSAWVTLYENYQPAKITMENGKVIKQNQANVFLNIHRQFMLGKAEKTFLLLKIF